MVDHKICINVRNLSRICLDIEGRSQVQLGYIRSRTKNHCSKLPHALTTLSVLFGMLSILLTVRGPKNRLVVLL